MEEIRVPGTLIIGCGGIGAAAAYHLAARGETVVGLDPRAAGHRAGSSHGRSRLVRQAYAEGSEYVALTTAAWRMWHELEAVADERILTASGVLAVAPPDDPAGLVTSTLAAAREHALPVEHLDASEIVRRFPAFRLGAGWQGAFEPAAGFVDPEATVRTHLRLAQEAGAAFRSETVRRIDFGDGAVVHTDAGSYRPDKVIVAAGPWAPELLRAAGVDVVARRKVVAHFRPERPSTVGVGALPGFAIHDGEGLYYGFPDFDGQGVKIGRHDGGESTTPELVGRRVRDAEVGMLRRVLDRFLPDAAGEELDRYTCLYTMSADEDFIVGPLPQHPDVIVATGCSGHAFKFVPVLGAILADLAQDGDTQYDIGFLSPARPAAIRPTV